MTTNRLILILIALTLMMQTTLLYKQFYGSGGASSAKKEASVKDAPKGSTLELANHPSKGSPAARVALIEFSDYECPFCSRYATGVAKELDKEFVETGMLKLVFVNNPLPIHPYAKSLATAAICAGDQGQYWEMHDSLFNLTPKTPADVLGITKTLSLDSTKFQQCTEKSPEPAKEIDRDMKKSKDLQFTGTPSFAIGQLTSRGQVAIKKLVIGAQPLAVFEKAIKEVLAEPMAFSIAPLSPIQEAAVRN